MEWWTTFPAIVAAAYLLDAVLGDPRWMPHPVRWIGRLISVLDPLLRRTARTPALERAAGVVLAVAVVGATYFTAYFILRAAFVTSGAIFFALSVYIVWSSIAARSLAAEARAVIYSLESDGLDAARSRLSMIVGRDTAEMTRAEVMRAASETVSENASDGVIAPLFFLAVGGPPLMLAYKAVNTLDSMVGYKNDKYLNFGWFSARLDDLANYVPARLTASLMVVSSMIFGYDWRASARVLIRDGANHSSPNSGLPEAATAGALGVSFGGPSSYGGVVVEKPFIGDGGEPTESTVSGAVRIMRGASHLMVTTIVFISCFSEFLPIVKI